MIYQILGCALFLAGCSHAIFTTTEVERAATQAIQKAFQGGFLLDMFQEIWFLGRTAFALVALGMLASWNWKLGLIALSVFGVIVGLEHLVKGLFNRQRPFQASRETKMLQPREPLDASFPSGDALRAWYLALILSVAAGGSSAFWSASLAAALLVSVGRMVMGVHYLSDVIAGAGLGLLGAGTTIWLWQYFQVL